MIATTFPGFRDGVLMDVAPALAPFDELYRHHADAVYRFCLAQLRDPALAEDVAAEVFASAFSNYERVRPDAEMARAWLFRIARNAAIDHHRRQQRWRRLLVARRPEPAAVTVEAQAELRGRLRDVVEAMARLRRRDRELLGLRLAGGLSFAEIGMATGMTETAARVASHRALARLRQALERIER